MTKKLFAVLGLVLAMGITACDNAPVAPSKNSSQEQQSSSSVEVSSSNEKTSSQNTSSFFSSVVSSSQAASSSQTISSSEQKSSSSETNSSSMHTHSWGQGTITTEPGCETTGVKTYTCSCGETRTEEIDALGHDYGNLIDGYLPSYFYDGSKPYYQCSRCRQKFDSNKNSATDEQLKLEKASDLINITVNGEEKGPFYQVDKDESHAEWSFSGLYVNTGDVLSLTKPGDPTYKYQFFRRGNLDENNKIITSGRVDLSLTATPNGFSLSVSGYKYPGLVVKINDDEYPLNEVEYLDTGKETYIYGYHYFKTGDVMTVVDNVQNITYGYSNLEEDVLWNIYDFEEGPDNEIVFQTDARFGIEFNRDGQKRISITKTFAPVDRLSHDFSIQFEDPTRNVVLTPQTYLPSSSEYESFTWYIGNPNVINNGDILEYLMEFGLTIYSATVELYLGDSFVIQDDHLINIDGFDHVVDLRAYGEGLTPSGSYIRVSQTGVYEIGFLPCCNSIFIYASQQKGDAYIMIDGKNIPLKKDASNIVTYEAHFIKNQFAVFFDSNYQTITPTVIIGAETPVHIVSGYLIYFDKAGTFQLTLNLTSFSLIISAIQLDPEETPTEITGAYLMCSGAMSTKLISNPNYPDELVRENVEMKAGSGGTVYVTVYKEDLSGILEGVTLSPNSEDVAISVTAGSTTMFYLTAGPGTYSFYLNKKTLVLRIVKVS